MLRAAAVLGITSLLLFQAGCNDDTSFYIFQNQVPETGCVVTTDDAIYRSQGVLDVSLGAGYVLFPLLRNDLPTKKPAGDLSERPEPNQLHLREFRVQLDLGSTPNSVLPDQLTFSRPTSGSGRGSSRSSQGRREAGRPRCSPLWAWSWLPPRGR